MHGLIVFFLSKQAKQPKRTKRNNQNERNEEKSLVLFSKLSFLFRLFCAKSFLRGFESLRRKFGLFFL